MSVDLSSITIKELPRLSERVLRNEIIEPLLREIGFDYVENCHGPRECGIDIYFETKDFLGRPRYFGVSSKKGDLNRKAVPDRNSILTIFHQMDLAFETVFHSSNNDPVHLHGYYVIASGGLTSEAKDTILARRSKYPYVDIIDGPVLFGLIQQRKMLRNRYDAWKRTAYQPFSDESEVLR